MSDDKFEIDIQTFAKALQSGQRQRRFAHPAD
ncbi:hypothetical protein Vspart_01033 [Vibrio spartinae]|uniref:Uncharacterized protein n=1 Tax=Vibrio spartinae TaxID=1918945 RepID=A0ABX6QX04_9VIBR|nr:hypothetical protein Vspart_01033 [Vibrio spartinae]